jgi:RNA polymerase sigma factor (sigma-70 family)
MTNEELAERINGGETSLYSVLWEQTKHFFKAYSARFFNLNRERSTKAGLTVEDYHNSCYFALVKAVEAYDPQKGFTLLTFVNYPLRNLFYSLLGTRGRKHVNPLNDCSSLNETVRGAEGETEQIDLLEDPESGAGFERLGDAEENRETRKDLERAIEKHLTSRQAEVISRHFFDGVPYSAIAEEKGVTRSAIDKSGREGLKALRQAEELQKYRDKVLEIEREVLETEAWKCQSLTSFHTLRESSVERAVRKAEEESNRELGRMLKKLGLEEEYKARFES